jgi:hypothetical protein
LKNQEKKTLHHETKIYQELYVSSREKKKECICYVVISDKKARDQIPPTGCGRGQLKKEYAHLLWRLSNYEGKDQENKIST